MTWSYTGLPGSRSIDMVRLLIGDTQETEQQLSDEEIQVCIDNTSSNYFAAAQACLILQAKYAKDIGSTIESIRIFAGDRQEHYRKLADSLLNNSIRFGAILVGDPIITGDSKSEIDTVDSDTDRVGDLFSKEQFQFDVRNSDNIPEELS